MPSARAALVEAHDIALAVGEPGDALPSHVRDGPVPVDAGQVVALEDDAFVGQLGNCLRQVLDVPLGERMFTGQALDVS